MNIPEGNTEETKNILEKKFRELLNYFLKKKLTSGSFVVLRFWTLIFGNAHIVDGEVFFHELE